MNGTRAQRPRTMFVFMDESGDLQFTTRGKKHFVLSAVCTTSPSRSAEAMQVLKYDLLAEDSDQLEFHATDNNRGTRKRVINTISRLDNIRVHSIWIDKRLTPPDLQDEFRLLGLIGGEMGRWVHSSAAADCDKIILIFDSVLTGKKQKAFVKQLKQTLAPLKKDIKIYFHPVKQDLNGQIADYYSWALFRSLESGDDEMKVKLIEGKPEWDESHMLRNRGRRYWAPEK